MTYAELLSSYLSYFTDHQLDPVIEAGMISVYSMHAPGTRVWSVQLTETPECLHITGDVLHGRDAKTAAGLSLAWFRGATSPNYIAEKFDLELVWQPDLAKQFLVEAAEAYEDDPKMTAAFKQASAWIGRSDHWHWAQGAAEFNEALEEAGFDVLGDFDGTPGFGPRIEDLAMLEAVRSTFVRLWEARCLRA